MNIFAQAATDAANEIIKVEWYQKPTVWALFGILGAIFVAVFLGKMLAKAFKTPELSGKIGLLLWCVMVSAIVISIKPLKFGVDLRGGVTIIGQMNDQPGVPADEKVTIQKIIPILKERIDPSGVREIAIRGLGKDKMEVIIPDVGKEGAERVWNLLTSAGQLYFRIVADENQHPVLCGKARDMVTTQDFRTDVIGDPDTENPNGKKIGEWTSLAREAQKPGTRNVRMPFKFLPMATHVVKDKQTGDLISMSELRFGGDEAKSRQQFSDWCASKGYNDVQILMAEPPNDRQNVKGEYLLSVQKGFDENAKPRIEFRLTPQGGKRLFSLTQRNKPVGDRKSLLGIVLDKKLQSAPNINEPIRTNGVIEGNFTNEEIEGYTAVLSSGKLDVALRKNWISMDQIRSTLGEELKTKGLMAIAISLGLVLVFMVIYYRFCGMVACVALSLNLIFTMAILMLINVNLTLTGLAGLVLTIGMSVDANVLIFERIREELTRGAALRMAIRNGFDRATTTIVDANLTTLITAVILYIIGTDQIRSFSVTLIVGILMCMFSAIFCSRIFFNVAERRRWITKLNMSKIIGNNPLDFLGKRHITTVLSLVLITVGMVAFFARGKGILDTDLAGGSTARVEFTSAKTVSDIRDSLTAANFEFENDPIRYSVTQMKDNDNAFKVDSSLPVIDDEANYAGGEVPKLDEILGKVFDGQLVMLNVNYSPSQIKFTKDGVPVDVSTSGVGGGPNMGPSFGSLDPLQEEGGQEDTGAEETKQDDPPADPPSTSGETQGESELGAPESVQETPTTSTPGRRERYTAEVDLEFAHDMTGDTVKGYLADAAESLGDVPLLEEDIKITLPAGVTMQDHAKNWNVKVDIYDPNDATRVFEKVKSTMDSQPYFASSSGVGGQVASRAQQQALVALIASLVGIIAYVWIRFQNVAFGLAAIVALVHDVLIVLGAIALSYWLASVFGFLLIEDFRISLSVVAALLTVIGYSLNDTIVVFDRVREVRGKRSDITADMINTSISQTLSRTILTSITTLIVILILYVLGGESIHAFAFALLIGVVVGTYSSIFVASPALLWLMNRGVAPPQVTPEKATGK